MNNENSLEILGIDLKMIQDSPHAWSINKSLAFKLSFNSFSSLGDFLKMMSDENITFLMHAIDSLDKNDEEDAVTEFMMLTYLLSYAEGLDIVEDLELMSTRTNVLAGFIVAESMARKGLAELTYENMSLGEDALDLVVITPTQMGIDLFNQIKDDPDAI